MANMLTVAALRGQLQKRGLDTDGRKATLVSFVSTGFLSSEVARF